MSQKVDRVTVNLDPGDVKDLSEDDIRIILRGADDLIIRHMGRLPNIHAGEVLPEEFLKPLKLSQNRIMREIGVARRQP